MQTFTHDNGVAPLSRTKGDPSNVHALADLAALKGNPSMKKVFFLRRPSLELVSGKSCCEFAVTAERGIGRWSTGEQIGFIKSGLQKKTQKTSITNSICNYAGNWLVTNKGAVLGCASARQTDSRHSVISKRWPQKHAAESFQKR